MEQTQRQQPIPARRETNPFDNRTPFQRNLAFAKMEAVFVGFIVPTTAVVSVLILIGQVLALPTALWRGREVLEPWHRMMGLWQLVGRHVRYVSKYVFLTHYRQEAARAWERAREQMARVQTSLPRPNFDLRLLDGLDDVDATVLFALMPHLFPWAVLMPHMVYNVVTAIVLSWSWHYYGVASPPRAAIVAAPVVYQPQVADAQETDYGPWQKQGAIAEQTKDPAFRNIALLSDDGSAKYSLSKVGLPDGFEPRVTERIVGPAVEPTGQIQFSDQHGNVFRMNPGQVFLIENDRHAYLFRTDGTLLATRLQTLKTEETEHP